MADGVEIIHGDCLAVLPTLAAGSVDAVISDPPYPCIDRSYGRWTEAEWFALMDPVVAECRRVLKPTGSAVFVLQPNSERVGRMRTWLWEFMAKWGREWGVVQDAYWWNTSAMPLGGACRHGLMRSAVRACVWLGPPDCHRDQSAVLMPESSANRSDRDKGGRARPRPAPSRKRSDTEGDRENRLRLVSKAAAAGGTTPFNVLRVGSDARWSGGTHGHGASTPLKLLRWWTRYVCPPGGTVLDPFAGSFTGAVACIEEGRRYVGVERDAGYVEIGRRRVAALRRGVIDWEPVAGAG